jgi:hypothetical protein
MPSRRPAGWLVNMHPPWSRSGGGGSGSGLWREPPFPPQDATPAAGTSNTTPTDATLGSEHGAGLHRAQRSSSGALQRIDRRWPRCFYGLYPEVPWLRAAKCERRAAGGRGEPCASAGCFSRDRRRRWARHHVGGPLNLLTTSSKARQCCFLGGYEGIGGCRTAWPQRSRWASPAHDITSMCTSPASPPRGRRQAHGGAVTERCLQ